MSPAIVHATIRAIRLIITVYEEISPDDFDLDYMCIVIIWVEIKQKNLHSKNEWRLIKGRTNMKERLAG